MPQKLPRGVEIAVTNRLPKGLVYGCKVYSLDEATQTDALRSQPAQYLQAKPLKLVVFKQPEERIIRTPATLRDGLRGIHK